GGRTVNEVPPREREVALVFKHHALYPHLSVAGNLAFALTARKYPKAEIQKRVGQAATLLGIEKILERKPAELSAAQSVRIALGRAIVRQPKVFLFDDPLAGLDAAARGLMRTEIGRLHQRLQTTWVYVTRDPAEAMTLGQRVGVLDGGTMQQLDAPLKIYHEPANQFVAGFLGSPPMNFVRGKLSAVEGGGLVFKETDGALAGRFPDGEASAAFQKFAGKEVILGVRPEDIAPLPPATTPIAPAKGGKNAASDGSFQAVVEQVETSGAEIIFHLRTGDDDRAPAILCRSPASLLAPDEARAGGGHRRRFQINAARAHLFDPATSQRIA
ncbi:MAG: ABC transporter ATP-binding protein, partial [Verrucomicrobia bacterium]|nr:ABC transporter ATP-binding protein [Verrucomicrobiota bacterium]